MSSQSVVLVITVILLILCCLRSAYLFCIFCYTLLPLPTTTTSKGSFSSSSSSSSVVVECKYIAGDCDMTATSATGDFRIVLYVCGESVSGVCIVLCIYYCSFLYCICAPKNIAAAADAANAGLYYHFLCQFVQRSAAAQPLHL